MKYQVELLSMPADSVKLTRAMRVVGGMSLTRANDLCRFVQGRTRTCLVAGVEEDVALHIKTQLESVGAMVQIVASECSVPMVCDPAVGTKYRWGAFRSLRKAS